MRAYPVDSPPTPISPPFSFPFSKTSGPTSCGGIPFRAVDGDDGPDRLAGNEADALRAPSAPMHAVRKALRLDEPPSSIDILTPLLIALAGIEIPGCSFSNAE